MIYIPGQVAQDLREAQEDREFASKKARQFMRMLFGGEMPVRCTCGQSLKYKNNKLKCECGKILNRVAYEDDYEVKIIKTVIDVERKEFVLEEIDE